MTLNFQKKFKSGKETNFEEKILKGLGLIRSKRIPKLFTMRFLSEKRLKSWQKKDRLINFYTGLRTKNVKNFAPNRLVQSLHKVEIEEMIFETEYSVYFRHGLYEYSIDGFKLNQENLYRLARHDGFDNLNQFLDFFDIITYLMHRNHFKQLYLINWTELSVLKEFFQIDFLIPKCFTCKTELNLNQQANKFYCDGCIGI